MRHTTTLDVRLEHGETPRIPERQTRAARHFACRRVGCDRISLPRPSVRRKIMPIGTGIGGMSVQVPLLPDLARMLDENPDGATVYVISEETGQPYKPHNFRHIFAEIRI
jgi:hypothetical protein